MGAAFSRPQDLSVGWVGASGGKDAGQEEMTGDCSRATDSRKDGFNISG